MKKLILLTIVLLPIFASAQFKQGVGFEYLQRDSRQIYQPKPTSYVTFSKGDFTVLYKLQYKYKGFKAESLAALYMVKASNDWTFAPTHSEFTVSIAYTVDKIKIKASHLCVHPMITDNERGRVQMTGSSTIIGIYYNFD